MTDRLEVRDDLRLGPSEDPYVVEQGGFYRRWLSLLSDIDELQEAVEGLEGTTDDIWVPHWTALGRQYEESGDGLEETGDPDGAAHAYLQAKTYYSLARFPATLTPLKQEAHDDCVRAYHKATAHLDPPLHQVEIECEGRVIPCHFRAPAGASEDKPVPAVLIMCGADMFKEDRGWAAELALNHDLGALVMDAPGTGENPFPHEPESVRAWMAAVDWLGDRPEVDGDRVGALGISRGGHSVLHLAGSYPERVRAVVASAGNHFGYQMTPDEAEKYVAMRTARATHVFGAPGDGPTFEPTTLEQEDELLAKWSLAELGVLEQITMPVLMINGKQDHLTPIGNIYYMLEHGPVAGKEARVYPDDGHCAPRHRHEWAPASFEWLAAKLGA